MRGLVFAANPIQEATDLWQYKAELRSFYADSAFWDEVPLYVRFWAQEAYADVRAWGVTGNDSGRADRLPERLLPARTARGDAWRRRDGGRPRILRERVHADRQCLLPVAAARGDRLRLHDVDLPTMVGFVSTKTTRPACGGERGSASRTLGTAPRRYPTSSQSRTAWAAAIRDSESDAKRRLRRERRVVRRQRRPAAAFTSLWREFLDVTPPTIVVNVEGPVGSNGWYTGRTGDRDLEPRRSGLANRAATRLPKPW